MKAVRGRAGAFLASVVLAVLTVTVFAMLQDYGPESALRKFHRAAVNRSLEEILEVVSPESQEQNVNELAAMVDTFARRGARYQLLHVKRGDRRVVAEVAYVAPNSQQVVPVLWVVEKERGRWRVNANATVELMRRAYGLG